MNESAFSESYTQARERFLQAAVAADAEIHRYPVSSQLPEDLSIDVACLGPRDAPTLVTSSGVHGVEGFIGSAIQFAWLQQAGPAACAGPLRHVLIHAVNPYGFATIRRFDEQNIDVNRNFLTPTESYAGVADGYRRVNAFLNPTTPPTPWELYRPRAMLQVARHGLRAIQQAVAGGQYEFPRGLFFGGHAPSQSAQLIKPACDAWIAAGQPVMHLDFHTGLGRYGICHLLLGEAETADSLAWYSQTFGASSLELPAAPGGVSYHTRGAFVAWMQRHFGVVRYRAATAEFGTYAPIRVLGALRAENRAYNYGQPTSRWYQAAKREILECFCPSDPKWRHQVLTTGLTLVDQAQQGLRRGE